MQKTISFHLLVGSHILITDQNLGVIIKEQNLIFQILIIYLRNLNGKCILT